MCGRRPTLGAGGWGGGGGGCQGPGRQEGLAVLLKFSRKIALKNMSQVVSLSACIYHSMPRTAASDIVHEPVQHPTPAGLSFGSDV